MGQGHPGHWGRATPELQALIVLLVLLLPEGPQLHFRPGADRMGLASGALRPMSLLLLRSVFDLIRASS